MLCRFSLDVFNGTLDANSSFAIVIVANAVIGGLVASRRPTNPVGWLFLGGAVCLSLNELGGEYAIYGLQSGEPPLAGAAGSITIWSERLGATLLFVFLPLYFPNGRLVSPRWRPVARLAFLLAVASVISAFMPGKDVYGRKMINPLGIEALRPVRDLFDAVGLMLFLGLILIAMASLVVRFRRSGGEERQQLKWFMYAVSTVLVWFVVNRPIEDAAPELFLVIDALVIAGIPVAAGIAILKYHLFDIDLVINRTLVYGTLTACVVGIYVLVVGYLGTLFRVEGNLLISLVAAGLVAVLFQPLRERLQRGINHLMYGERDEPYTAVSRLGERLEGTLAPEAVLPAIVETVREALKLPYAAIALPQDGGNFEVAAASEGKPPAEPLILPLSYGGETVGRLLLAPRAPGEGFSSADRRLLDSLARHAGVAVQGVRTMADLRRSREKLVLAREEERRRLRRDLHDELAPTLAALGLGAATVGELIPTDPKGATSVNEKLRTEIRATVGDVRRLVYDLRPPALDELGLVGAVRERALRYDAGDKGFRVKVEAPEELPPLPAAVEVAAYRIVQEALTNVSRHAKARSCTVRLACSTGQMLEVEVTDDGVGLPDTPEGGVGLSSMRERAVELGGECEIGRSSQSTGGTRVFARLPLTGPEGRTV
jgi:signal transduction histidine kinase